MREGKFQRQVLTVLRGSGACCLNVVGNMLQGSGWPDIIIFWKGKTLFIELKIRNGKLSNEQRAKIAHLRSVGHQVGVLRYYDDCNLVMKDEAKARGEVGVVLDKLSLTELFDAVNLWEAENRQ